jgi:UDP-N-acetylmuramoyl-tripeptide--D-alanyl-D-alanine ligase
VIGFTLAELAAAAGGRLEQAGDPAAVLDGPVVADSRQVVPGALLVALPGERVDGHDFVAAGFAAGAAAALVSRRPAGVDGPLVLVDDVLVALGRLARALLDRLAAEGTGLRVVALTGSSGKTSTKDLLAGLLAEAGETIAPPGSFNNELGVPLTVLRATRSTRFLLLELGARGVGHIAYLCRVAPPAIGLVLNVGAAHSGEFGGKEATATAKGELVEALPADGVAVLNRDDPWVASMASRTVAPVVWFGSSDDCEVRAEDVDLDPLARPSFRLVTPEGSAPVTLRLHGAHHVDNALAAAAVGRTLGLTVERVAELLAGSAAASRWRMEVTERPDGVVLVNDSYNANPESVRAALQALGVIGRGRRTWAVLGEMLELGPKSQAEHEAVGRAAAELGVDQLVAVGEGARPVLSGAAGPTTCWVPDVEGAAALLTDRLRPGDVVLVKASRSIGLDRLAAALLTPEPAGPAPERGRDSGPGAGTGHNPVATRGHDARPDHGHDATTDREEAG